MNTFTKPSALDVKMMGKRRASKLADIAPAVERDVAKPVVTEAQAIASTRTQYRAAFHDMACGGQWNLYATRSGVTLDRAGAHLVVLVEGVHAMAEQTVVNCLSTTLRKGTPHLWAD